jgi:cell division protein ZipA
VRESRDESDAEPLAASAGGRRRSGARRRHPSQMDLGFDEADTESGVASAEERVVALYLKAPEDGSFGGEELQQALAAVDLRFGEMSIFHHFGIGKLYAPRPLFSVANMYEPGTIEIDRIDDFSTQGLTFFLRVPARVDSSLVFELMLNTAQRLADRLGGELLDDTHAPLTTQAIGQLRKLVKEHDPR